MGWARTVAALALLSASAGAAPERHAAAPPVLMVVPFAASGDSDAAWIPLAAAELLLARAAGDAALSFITVRQLNSVLKRRDQLFDDLVDPREAAAVGRSLGATHALVGTVRAFAGRAAFALRLVRVPGAESVAEAQTEAALQDMQAVVGALGGALWPELGHAAPPAPPAVAGEALRLTSACLSTLLPQPLGPRARALLAPEAVARARAWCGAAVQADPAFGLARAGFALALSAAGDPEAGRKEARAAASGGFVPLAVLAESWAATLAGDGAAAVAVLERAVAAHPGFLHAQGYLGEHAFARGAYAEGLAAFEAYLARAPGHPWAMGQLGYALARVGRIEEALAVTREALARDPGNPELSIELGARLIDAGRLDEAVEALTPALKADPPRPLAQLRIGYVRLLQGRLSEAVAPLQRAVVDAWREDEFKTRGYAHFDLARVRAQQGRLDEALAELEDARAEGEPRRIPCNEPDLAPLLSDARFLALCDR